MSATTTRLRLDFAYDGTNFSGWAKQPGLRTVEDVLEQAIQQVLQLENPARLVVAGRTDAGVHATHQVAHLDLEPNMGRTRHFAPDVLAHKLNRVMAHHGDIVIHQIREVSLDFDARFSAMSRRYIYRIVDSDAKVNPLDRHFIVRVPKPLDEGAMNEAAEKLLGLRDFATFCKPRAGSTTIRELQEFEWTRMPDGTLEAQLRADAFCHSMVRALVGACVAAGSKRLGVADVERLRDAEERTSAIKVMPAHGLTLVEVVYPSDDELATRATQTRGRRELETDPPLQDGSPQSSN